MLPVLRRLLPAPRPRLAALCAVLAVLVAAVAGVLMFLRVELLSPERFADHAVEAVMRPDVRDAIAERVVTQAIEVEPDLLTARPLLEGVVADVVEAPAFQRLVRAAAREAHRVLFDPQEPPLVVDIVDAARVVVPAVRSVDPELARELPRRIEAPLAALDRRSFATETIRAAQRVRVLAVLAPPLALALLLAAVALAADRRRALRRLPLALAAAAGLVLLALALAEPDAARRVRGLSPGEVDAAVDDVWDLLVGDLRVLAVAAGLGGLAVAALLSPRARAATAPLSALLRATLASPPTRGAQLVRGAALLTIGALVVLARADLVYVAGLALGALLLARGVADLLGVATAVLPGVPRPGARRLEDDDVDLGALARFAVPGLAALVAVGLGVSALADNERAGGLRRVLARGPITACNGMRELCDRRLNEVVFAGTHNSMSAADDEGWLFANQRRGVLRQLDDGIRLLLLDAHWGVRASNGRIRTDLAAEGTSRNRVAKLLGPEAVATAERLAGRLGVGDRAGRRGLWLCHSLCELGATRMGDALRGVRGWLDRHPGELVVLLVEPSVPAWAVEREFRAAGLLPRVAALDRDAPLPTLRELLARGRQLVVFGERDVGSVPWYHEAFSWIQDTPLGPGSASSCTSSRGDPASPVLMVNHWVDRFPPPPSANAKIGSRSQILERVRRCERERGVRAGFVAVDHYDLGDVVGAVRELNRRPVAAPTLRPRPTLSSSSGASSTSKPWS
jgi:hypothetical protein